MAQQRFYIGMFSMGMCDVFLGIPDKDGQPIEKCFGWSCSDMVNISVAVWILFTACLLVNVMTYAVRHPLYTLRYITGLCLSFAFFSALFHLELLRVWGPLAVNVGILFGMMIREDPQPAVASNSNIADEGDDDETPSSRLRYA